MGCPEGTIFCTIAQQAQNSRIRAVFACCLLLWHYRHKLQGRIGVVDQAMRLALGTVVKQARTDLFHLAFVQTMALTLKEKDDFT